MKPTPETDSMETETMHDLIGDQRDESVRLCRKLERERDELLAILANPVAVHLNMMRGTIKWTPENLKALLGDAT